MKFQFTMWFTMGAIFLSCGQSASTMIGARIAGLGYAGTAVTDEFALFNNPGSLSYNKSSTFFSFEVRPSLEGANRMAAGIQFRLFNGIAAAGVFRFGDNLYNEQLLCAAFSHKLGLASLGARINYHQFSVEGFGTRQALTLDFGGLAEITPQISVGARISNVTQSSESYLGILPVVLAAGICFRPQDHFLFTTEIEKDIRFPATWKAGIEYVIHEKMFFRTGFNLNPQVIYAGSGIRLRHLKFDYSITFNSNLGNAYQASAIYQFNKKS